MASELREARSKIEAHCGDQHALCNTCRPEVENHVLKLGLVVREGRNNPSCGIKICSRLDSILENSTRCWVCAWLLQLVQNRQGELFATITEDERAKVHVGIESQHIHTFETGRTFTHAGEDKRTLVRISIYVDPRNIGKEFRYMLQLQQSDEHPPNLHYLLDQHAMGDIDSYAPFSTRIRPPAADLRLLAWWKDECQARHGQACRPLQSGRIKMLRFIDTQTNCIAEITDLSKSFTWTALSYCWGGEQTHKLLASNLLHYQQAGSLDFTVLPKVIQDAITITRAIGERYIWIDSMCIIQDSEADKVTFLPIMDAVYKQASATIVNAATSAASDAGGLPGISSPGSRRKHELFQVNGTWLTESLDPGYSTYGDGFIMRSTWSSRGWTFQEGYLSQRSIIITPDQIYWQCQKASWCEGSIWERHDDKQIYRHCFGDLVLGALFDSAHNFHWSEIYLSVLKNYQRRTFSSENDRLHALAGVLRVIEQYSDGEEKFFWAMPQSRLEQGLAFTVMRSSSRRIASHTKLDTSGELIGTLFPSWSWLGWEGQTGLETIKRSTIIGTIGLKFYRIEPRGEAVRIDIPHEPPEQFPEGDIRRMTAYPQDIEHAWLNQDQQSITQADIPSEVFLRKDIVSSLLCFWTSSAVLQIEPLGPNNYYNEFAARLSDGNTAFMGLWPGISRTFDFPRKGRFIVVSVEKERMSRGGRLMMKLLLITEDETLSGVYRRQAVVTNVGEDDWNKLESKAWELVVLA